MPDVNIKYKGNSIGSLSDSGTKTLKTQGKYLEGDVAVEYTKPSGGEEADLYASADAPANAEDGSYWVDFSEDIPPEIDVEPKNITENGTYTAPSGKAYSPVTVNVPTGTPRSSADLTVSGRTVTAPAGLYSDAASKSVPAGTQGTPTATKSINGTTATVTPQATDTTGYIAGTTKTGTAVTVTAAELDTKGTKNINANGTGIDVTGYSAVDVAVPTGTARSASDVTASGATVTVPAGLYDTQVQKSVASGSISLNMPTIDESGLVTATANLGQAGYVDTAPSSKTLQLPMQGAQTIMPGLFTQTIAAGKYLTGAQTIDPITAQLLASLDANFKAENIKGGVDMFGLVGTMPGAFVGSFTLTARQANTTVTHGLGRVPSGCAIRVGTLTGTSTIPILLMAYGTTSGILCVTASTSIGSNAYSGSITDASASSGSINWIYGANPTTISFGTVQSGRMDRTTYFFTLW